MALRGLVVAIALLGLGCFRQAKPTTLEATSSYSQREVFSCIMARTTPEGYVPSGGGVNDSFLELTKGRENLGAAIVTGTDSSYNEGLTVIALGEGQYQLAVYTTNANVTRNAVRRAPGSTQLEFASAVWDGCVAKRPARQQCLSFEDDYAECLEAGGYDPTKEQ